MTDLASAYVQIVPSARGMKQGLADIFGGEMPSAGKSAGGLFGSGLVSKLKGIIAAAGIGTALKETISAGADLQQSLGGVETLFKENAAAVIANARQAYKTVGMSANGYMEQVTSFSASLLQSLQGDTAAAASVADMAMTDMSDNANKFGTDMGRITDAYQGFAKQNYTMLDNLKLGYGGTKTEMQRLLKDATALTGVKYDINNLSDVYSAIHAIQKEMGVTGTTAKEASSTITGSANAMKAAFTDVLGNLALGRDIQPSLNALAQTTVTFLKGNLVPAVINIITALPGAAVTLVKALLPGNMQQISTDVINNFTAFMTEGLPTILSSGEQMIGQLVAGFTGGGPGLLASAGALLGQVLTTIIAALPSILQSGINIVTELANGFLSAVPTLLETAGMLLQQVLTAFIMAAPSLLSTGVSYILNLASGFVNSLPNIVASAGTIIANLLSTFASHLPDLLAQGISLIGQLVAGLISMIPDVIQAAVDIGANIITAFGETDWVSIGVNIINGIVSGIWNAASSLFNALKDLAGQALQAAKDTLGIQSPSRVFRREVGYMLPAGAALGVTDGIPLVRQAMGRLSNETASAFTSRLRVNAQIQRTGSDAPAGFGRSVSVVQNIYSQAQTAADLMQEARYQQELAVMLGV